MSSSSTSFSVSRNSSGESATYTLQASSTTLQKSLLVATTACVAISLIPTCRLIGMFSLRATSLITAIVNSATDWANTDTLGRVAKCAKIAAIILGIVAVALISRILIIASIAMDLGIQLMETIKAICIDNTKKALTHLGIMVVDALLLAATITLKWPFMVAAAAINAVVMGVIFFCYLRNANKVRVEHICYPLLALANGVVIESQLRAPAPNDITTPLGGTVITTKDLP